MGEGSFGVRLRCAMLRKEKHALLGSSIEGERRQLLGEFLLRGAARWRRGEGYTLSWGAPALRGCPMEGGRRLLLGGFPLRGAARLRGEGGCFWGGFRCAGLLDGGGKEAASGGGGGGGAARLREGRRLLLGSSRCVGLLD